MIGGMSEVMQRKVVDVIAAALEAMGPEDLAERIEFCRRTGEHGTSVFFEGAAVRFTWGGRDLAIVERRLLVDDDLELPAGEVVDATVPDTLPAEWMHD